MTLVPDVTSGLWLDGVVSAAPANGKVLAVGSFESRYGEDSEAVLIDNLAAAGTDVSKISLSKGHPFVLPSVGSDSVTSIFWNVKHRIGLDTLIRAANEFNRVLCSDGTIVATAGITGSNKVIHCLSAAGFTVKKQTLLPGFPCLTVITAVKPGDEADVVTDSDFLLSGRNEVPVWQTFLMVFLSIAAMILLVWSVVMFAAVWNFFGLGRLIGRH
ncbi:hypothetical protein KIPB_009525 [Kipferlia bialata]|uniref:Uncharacterized protein n=1 Tax=Kipferlia bialata TaxID=797122 RepID=A0A9K3GMC2_9EUKA|nr:hypothetical protein KIPB_009525 [Kipferlia bialata]|eukprot:g9525.t1